MVSKGTLGQLRISPDDLLAEDDLLYGDYVDQVNTKNKDDKNPPETIWLRNRLSSKGHRLSPDHQTAYCGYTLLLSEHWYESIYRPWHNRVFGEDPGDWFIAVDRRSESSHCADCKPKNAMPDSRFLDKETVEEPGPEDLTPASFVPTSPAEMREHMKFLSRVAYVANELRATVL